MTDPVQSTALSTVSAQHTAGATPPNPVTLVADRLQNRWIPALGAGVVLAAALGAAGYTLAPVKYASTGLLSVEYSLDAIIDDTPETQELDNYDAYVLQQAALVADPRVLEAAVTRARGGTIS